MKTLLMLPVFILIAVRGGMGTSNLPRPWLSLDRTATVLHLHCRPPPEALKFNSWQAVYDLRLFAFLPQHSPTGNVSLVEMASDWKEPRVNPKFTISQASVQGDWDSKSVSLDFVLPVTDKELGHYFCIVDYMNNNDRLLKFATRVPVDKDFVFSHLKTAPKTEQNFEVRVEDAHKVHVTWTKPTDSKFTEASVSRVLTGDGEKSISNSKSLFTTDGDTDFVYGSQVLLKKLNKRDSGNMSITLYVKKDQHSANYRYSCQVPYPACRGQNAVLCTCCQQGSNPDREMCSNSPDSEPLFPLYVYVLVLFLVTLSILVVLVVMYVLFKTRKCSEDSWLQKFFTQQRESTPEKQPGKLPSPAVVLSSCHTEKAFTQSKKHPPIFSPTTEVNQEETRPLVGTRLPDGGEGDDNSLTVQGKKETGTHTVVSLPPKGTTNGLTGCNPDTDIPPRQQHRYQSHGHIPLQDRTDNATCYPEEDKDSSCSLEEEDEGATCNLGEEEGEDSNFCGVSVHPQGAASPPLLSGKTRHVSAPTSDQEWDIECSNRTHYSVYNPQGQHLIYASHRKQVKAV